MSIHGLRLGSNTARSPRAQIPEWTQTSGFQTTVISPFVVTWLLMNYQLPGVIWLMIGLVLVQILVVWAWGVEPAKRGLEEVATAEA